jgi:hypothetical protein
VTELACLAYCRRKFFDLQATGGHPVADEDLRRIGEFYAIEVRATATPRSAWRYTNAKAWHQWLIAKRRSAADGSGLARAIDYSLKRWSALVQHQSSIGGSKA